MWHHLTALLDLTAGSYSLCVWNAEGEQIYGYHERTVRSAASLIKVPLAMAVYGDALLGCPGIDLDLEVTLNEATRVEGQGAFDRAPAGTTKTVRDLVGHTLRESDNTAANLLLRQVGFHGVNRLTEALGLQTRMRRKFMDFQALAAGRDNTTSASDMCALLHRLLQPHYQPFVTALLEAVGDGKLEAGIPASVPVAHKVGDVPGVEHDAGIVFAAHNPYIVAALGVDLPDVETGRRTIAAASRMVWEGVRAR